MRLLKSLLIVSTFAAANVRAQVEEDDPTGLISRRASEALAIGIGAGAAYNLKEDAKKWQEWKSWKANPQLRDTVEAELRREVEAHVRYIEAGTGHKLSSEQFKQVVEENLALRRSMKNSIRTTAIEAAQLRLKDLDDHVQMSEEDFNRLAGSEKARRAESLRLLREKPRAWIEKNAIAIEQGKIITKKDYLLRRSLLLKYIADQKAKMPMLRPRVPYRKLLGVGLGGLGAASLGFDLAVRAKAQQDEMKELEEQVEEAKRAHARGEYDQNLE